MLTGGGVIHHPLYSEDTNATLRALEAFSAEVQHDEQQRQVRITSHPPTSIESQEIFVRESGTLLRFLIPICTVLEGPREVTLVGQDSLRNRSNTEPVDSLRSAGFSVDASGDDATVPITCYPGQQPTEFPVDVACSTTSQYLSGWLLTLAGLGEGKLRRSTELVSAPYVTMTENVLEEAGYRVDHPDEESYLVSRETNRSMDYDVPGDYSSAAFFLVGACLSEGTVTLSGLRPEDPQADRRIVEILDNLGVSLSWVKEDGGSDLRVEGKANVGGFRVDASDCPDLAPILSVLGAFCSGESIIENVGHLTNKESDRINRTAEELRKTGVEVDTTSDRLTVRGTPQALSHVELCAHGDHRLAMAFSILATHVGNVTVSEAESVKKSYPGFYTDLETLGADFELID